MTRLLKPVLAALLSGAFLTFPGAYADEASDLAARGVIMRTRDVRPGMRGIGKTVFQGTNIETFDIEVISVIEHWTDAGGSVILIKILNGPVVERRAGIIAGMSGSPVYLDGKLIGAVAYGWPGSLEPIGGVTPIEDMLASLEPKEATKHEERTALLPTPLRIGRQTFTEVRLRGFAGAPHPTPPATLTLRPVVTPVLVSGFRQRTFPTLKQLLAPYGLEPVPGAGGRLSGLHPPMVPGAAVGVDLVSGDFAISAGGTLTYRDGNRVLAFGHPFLSSGKGLTPLCSSFVHTIMPHRNRSFKLMSSIEPVGAVTLDWVAGIGGVLGRKAPVIPVRITTRDPERHLERTYRFSVVNHKDLTSSLVVSAALDACYGGFGSQTDGTLKISLRAEGKGIRPIVRHNLAYTQGDVTVPAVLELSDAVVNLTDNPFHRVHLTRLDLTVELVHKRQAAEIERVTVTPSTVKPGDPLHVSIVLKPKDGKRKTWTADFTIPKDTPSGTLRVGVGGGGSSLFLRQRLGLYLPRLTSLKDLLWVWNKIGSNNQLLIEVALPGRGAAVGSQQLPGLPPSVLQVMRASRTTGVSFPPPELSKSFDTSWDIAARVHFVSVRVAGKTGAPAAGGRRPSAPPPPRSATPSGGSKTAVSLLRGHQLCDSVLRDGVSLRNSTPFWQQVTQLHLWGDDSPAEPSAVAPKKPAAEESHTPGPGPARPPSGSPSRKSPPKPPAVSKKRPGIARPTQTWRVTGVKAFLQGENHNSGVSSAGDLRIAPAARKLFTADDLYVWDLAADTKGTLYAAVGNSGRIYRVPPGGKAAVWADTESAGVYALAVDKRGHLLAGLSPGARIVRFDSKGRKTVVCQLPEDYIWDFCWESDDALLVATGPHGRVYRLRLTDNDTPQVVYDLPQRHVRRVVRGPKGEFYASTADFDVLYRLQPKGRYETLFQSDTGEILGLCPAPDGALYYATTRAGDIYKRLPTGRVETFFHSAQMTAYDMVRDAAGNLYLATAGRSGQGYVYKVDSEGAGMRILEPDQGNALCLLLGARGKLWVGLGNDAAVHEVALTGNTSATYESHVYDARQVARWGTLDWTARTPKGCRVTLEFRAGNTAEPDNTWSPWQQPQRSGSLWSVPCPASQFLQFRARLHSDDGKETPRLQAVEVVYLPRNRAPTVSLKQPAGGVKWSGKKQVRWSASDPDGDPLVYKLFLSSDGGATWKPVKLKDPKKTSTNLDTKKYKDGVYRLKVVASDERANPGAGLTGEAVSEPFALDNEPPFVVMVKKIQPSKDRKSTVVRAIAVDQMSRVTGAEFRIDDGEWKATQAADGVFDSNAEDIQFRVTGLSGKHKAEVRVRDEAGNLTTRQREYDFPKPKKTTDKEPKTTKKSGA